MEQTTRRGLLNNINQPLHYKEDKQLFQLNTEKRAIKRREFESYIKTKSILAEATKKVRESERRVKEIQEIRSERSQTIFHANPIKHFKSLIIKPSDKPLTIPIPFNLHI